MLPLRLVAVWWWCVAAVGASALATADCAGDCNGDGVVTVDEIVRGVNLVLGTFGLAECPIFDANGDGEVTVEEIVAAVNALLNGCAQLPSPTASPSSMATPSPTPTARLLPTPTPTQPNRPPTLAPAIWYRGYAHFPIALPLEVSDPDGDPVRCTATGLPAGAELEEASWRILWVPGDSAVGNHEIVVQCHDISGPSAAVTTRVIISVYGPDSCSTPVCDPGVGCSRTLASLEAPCCDALGGVSLAVPNVPCPAGRKVWISEDVDGGFRALGDCDLKYVRTNAQASAEVRFKFRARCFSLDDRIVVSARMETRERTPVMDDRYRVRFYDAGENLVESRSVQFEVRPPAPFFDMQDAEANLVVTLTDGQLQTATESLRLRLTFTPVPQP